MDERLKRALELEAEAQELRADIEKDEAYNLRTILENALMLSRKLPNKRGLYESTEISDRIEDAIDILDELFGT